VLFDPPAAFPPAGGPAGSPWEPLNAPEELKAAEGVNDRVTAKVPEGEKVPLCGKVPGEEKVPTKGKLTTQLPAIRTGPHGRRSLDR
jgi:hypothetical protein